MKKLIVLFMVTVLCLGMCACTSTNEKSDNNVPTEEQQVTVVEPIPLTVDNLTDFVSISGEYTESGSYETYLFHVSTSVIDFQAYATSAGTFDNVEISVRLNVDGGGAGGAMGTNWHLADTDDHYVELTFKMPANGNYSHSYNIECNDIYSYSTLKGACDFTIVSVSGSFIPAN